MALKELEVRYATTRAKDYKLTDGEGLYLLVRPNGSKLWRMKYQHGGKVNWPPFRPDGFEPKKEAWGYPLSIGLCPCPRSSPTAVVAVTGARLRS